MISSYGSYIQLQKYPAKYFEYSNISRLKESFSYEIEFFFSSYHKKSYQFAKLLIYFSSSTFFKCCCLGHPSKPDFK